MPRSVPLKPGQVPAGSKLTLDTFAKNIGFTSNMMATFAQSPIAFNSWAALLGSFSKALDVKTRDGIGVAVSEVNGCNYCLTVQSFAAEHMAKLRADDSILARKGHAGDPKRDAAVQFARKVVETGGKVSDADLKTVRDVGYTDANVMEIVALVAMSGLFCMCRQETTSSGVSTRSLAIWAWAARFGGSLVAPNSDEGIANMRPLKTAS